MQSRIMEHLDRLKTYAAVREKIITLCQSSIDEADIGGVDSSGAGDDLGAWEGWWQDEVGGWREPEQMFPEEPGADIQGLADMKRRVCGAMGHMVRNCATPNPEGGGKGGKAGGKGFKGGPKGRATGIGEG